MTSSIKILPWDSRFFGRKIARVTAPRLTPTIARTALSGCAKKHVECLYFLASSNDGSSITFAQANGFRLMDIRVTLARTLSSAVRIQSEPQTAIISYRSARPSDLGSLRHLATTVFPYSRFAEDSKFPRGAHRKLFAEWVAKSVRGGFDDWVGVAVQRGQLTGFVSCRQTGRGTGIIGLIGVARAFRRHGIGRGLLQHASDWFTRHQIRHISVVTQGRAVEAQRFYQDGGFRTSRVDLWYHKWF